MFLLCKSGLFILVIAAASVSTVRSEPLPAAAFEDWMGHKQATTLTDGSVMTEFFTRVGALDNRGEAWLKVSFIPRFDCKPLISLQFDMEVAGIKGRIMSPDDVSAVDFSIDGSAINFPLIVDNDTTHISAYFSDSHERSAEVRKLIDLGDRARVQLPGNEVVAFSLLGSTKSVAKVEQLCFSHEPVALKQQ